jgi:hypothetical protein
MQGKGYPSYAFSNFDVTLSAINPIDLSSASSNFLSSPLPAFLMHCSDAEVTDHHGKECASE